MFVISVTKSGMDPPGRTMSGVENRRSSGSLPVAFVSAAFAERASIRFGMALFPVLAHRTGQAHLAHEFAPRECGWKHGDSGEWARKKKLREQHETRIPLTPTGLLMEGDYTQNPCSGHFECNRFCTTVPGAVAANSFSLTA